jgi:hypothetical protein
MELHYIESRPSVNSVTDEKLADINEPTDFRDAILAEIKICMDNDAQDVAHLLIDWHREVYDIGIEPGARLEHTYDALTHSTGVWEIR